MAVLAASSPAAAHVREHADVVLTVAARSDVLEVARVMIVVVMVMVYHAVHLVGAVLDISNIVHAIGAVGPMVDADGAAAAQARDGGLARLPVAADAASERRLGRRTVQAELVDREVVLRLDVALPVALLLVPDPARRRR
jgi:hypothetical protein